jgi:hypothetical protein
MASMTKYVKPNEFRSAAERHFRFLGEANLLGPEEADYSLSYSSGWFGVEVHYDDRDGRIITVVRMSVGERNPRASLQCLYVMAELGPAQDIREIARSVKSISHVLESHAEALRKLLPVIESDDGPDLVLACHGR